MSHQVQFDKSATEVQAAQHPLDPLSAAEMEAAVAMVRSHERFGDTMRFVSINLNEPAKEAVLNFREGDPIVREVLMVLLDNADGNTYEIVVSLTSPAKTQFRHIPGVQPSIIADEFLACEVTVKQHPEVQAALRKRGITDLDLITVDAWLRA